MEGAAVDKRNLNVLPEPFASSDLSLKGIETDVAFDDVLLREKVVIVGDEGVGKTSIVKSFLKKDDKLYGKTYVMTKGLDVEVSEVAVPNTNQFLIKVKWQSDFGRIAVTSFACLMFQAESRYRV